jgi:hypothetical protein
MASGVFAAGLDQERVTSVTQLHISYTKVLMYRFFAVLLDAAMVDAVGIMSSNKIFGFFMKPVGVTMNIGSCFNLDV